MGKKYYNFTGKLRMKVVNNRIALMFRIKHYERSISKIILEREKGHSCKSLT